MSGCQRAFNQKLKATSGRDVILAMMAVHRRCVAALLVGLALALHSVSAAPVHTLDAMDEGTPAAVTPLAVLRAKAAELRSE